VAEWFRQGSAKPCTPVQFRAPPPTRSPRRHRRRMIGRAWARSSAGERFPDTEEVTGSNPVAPTTHRRSSAAHSHSPAAPTGSPATRLPSNFPATSGLVAPPASTAATTRARTSPCCGAVGLATHVGLAAVRPTSSSGPADASPGSAAGRRRGARAALGGQPAGVYSSACQQLGAWLILAVPTRQAGRCTPGALLSCVGVGGYEGRATGRRKVRRAGSGW
jgi:hypothetical protein